MSPSNPTTTTPITPAPAEAPVHKPLPATSARSTLIYGASRTYKSTELMEIAVYLYRKNGRKLRVVTTEISSADIYQPYVDAEIVELFFLGMKHHPRSAIKKLTRGEWPKPVMEGGKMVAKFLPTTPEEWKSIGGYAFEGLTTMAEQIMQYLTGEGRKINEDVVGLYTEEGEKLGAAARSHYGAAQGDIMFLLKESPKALFDVSGKMVEQVLFTAHEAKGVDETTRQPMYGPAVVGGAITAKIAKEVGSMFHTQEIVTKDPKTQAEVKEVRAYFRSHQDPDNGMVTWQAGPRVAPSAGIMRELEKKFPNGYIKLSLDPRVSIAQFMAFHDDMRVRAAEEIRAQLVKGK